MGSLSVLRRWKELEKMWLLLKDVGHSVLIGLGCVSSRILWIMFMFSRVEVFVVVGYAPNEGDTEEWERFWNDVDRIRERVGNRYRL